MGTAAAAVVAIRRKERRETEEWSAGIRKSSKIWQRGKGPRCGCRRWQKRGSALGIEATRARPDESDGTTVLRFEHGSKRWIWATDRAYSSAIGRSSLGRSKASENKPLRTMPVTRKYAPFLAKIDAEPFVPSM